MIAPVDQAGVLAEAGFYLTALGRLAEASHPMKMALDTFEQLEDYTGATIAAENLSQNYLYLGDIPQAITVGRRCVELAKFSHYQSALVDSKATLADALVQSGDHTQALSLLQETEATQKKQEPQYPILYSMRGFQYCELLVADGKRVEAKERALRALQWVERDFRNLQDAALHRLILGRAALIEAMATRTADFAVAERYFNESVALRQAGNRALIPVGLIAQAGVYRVTMNFDRARRDLNEALTLTNRGGMRLHLATGNKRQASESLDEAKTIIDDTGYHRRDADVIVIQAQLHVAEGENDIGYE